MNRIGIAVWRLMDRVLPMPPVTDRSICGQRSCLMGGNNSDWCSGGVGRWLMLVVVDFRKSILGKVRLSDGAK